MSMQQDILSVEEMQAFAARIATNLRGGDVLELVGDVGAGKTTFTKALAATLGIDEPVQSPTFTLSSIYNLPNHEVDEGRLVHYDFYRLTDPGVMRDELREALDDPSTITVLEWADVVADVLPDDRLTIYFEYMADVSARRARIQARGPRAGMVARGVDR